MANPFILKSDNDPTLWMLRAFSKVEIKLSDDLLQMEQSVGNISIASATISNDCAANFWVIPELDRMNGFDTTGGTGQVTKTPGTGYQSGKTTLTDMSFYINEGGKSAVLYLPEYTLTSAENKKPVITLNLNLGANTYEFSFDFDYHGSDLSEPTQPWWQYYMRNHSYRFSVNSGFNIIVESRDWDYTFDNFFEFGSSISISQTEAVLKVGETLALTATAAPANSTVTWSSNNTAIATVDAFGTVTAVGVGIVTITATSSYGKTASCDVNVNAASETE